MMGKVPLLLCLLCALLLPLQISAYNDEFEGSGEDEDTSYFPTDDEDGLDEDDYSGSGDGIIGVFTDEIDETTPEITEEPEVNENKPAVIKEGSEKEKVKTPKKQKPEIDVEIDEIDIEITEEDVETPDDDPIIKESNSGLLDNKHFIAAVIIGGCIGLLCTIAVIMLLVYRMRKKDEGSYALDDKNTNFEYTKGLSKEYHV